MQCVFCRKNQKIKVGGKSVCVLIRTLFVDFSPIERLEAEVVVSYSIALAHPTSA